MLSVSTLRASRLVTALAAATLLASAANAALVVRSVGNGVGAFPVGKTVVAGTPITLTPGDMLTVLDGATTRTFRGPGTFDLGRAAAQTTTLAAAATALDSRAAVRKPRLGTVRGVPAIAGPSLWDVELDAANAGPQCVVDPANVTLRRAMTTTSRTITIAAGTGKPASVTMTMGAATAKWPKALPAMGSFTLTDSAAGKRSITFTKVPAPTGDAATDAEALIKAGCTQQLERFVKGLETGKAAGDD